MRRWTSSEELRKLLDLVDDHERGGFGESLPHGFGTGAELAKSVRLQQVKVDGFGKSGANQGALPRLARAEQKERAVGDEVSEVEETAVHPRSIIAEFRQKPQLYCGYSPLGRGRSRRARYRVPMATFE
jgi:hypothetical protein